MTLIKPATSACRIGCSTPSSGRRDRCIEVRLTHTEKTTPSQLACVVEDDLPAIRAFSPDKREDPVVLGRLAMD